MSSNGLPPLPPGGIVGPEICDTLRSYLAVMEDLPPEQAQIVTTHLQQCPDCVREYERMQRARQLVGALPGSVPSARVDAVIRIAIANQKAQRPVDTVAFSRRRFRFPLRTGGIVAAAAVLIVMMMLAARSMFAPTAFALPADLSWSGYVLHHSQTVMSSEGEPYRIDTYQNLADHSMHVETTMRGKLDVKVVGNQHKVLGMDMMNHVAAWNEPQWRPDGSRFDLARLRADLESGSAVYEGKDRFQNRDVYRIRDSNGLILLLDMHYMPVNVLHQTTGGRNGEPMYDRFEVMPASAVSPSMWDMRVPSGFKMGELPPRPL